MSEWTAFTGQQGRIRLGTIIITCLRLPAKHRLGLTKESALGGGLVEGEEERGVGEVGEVSTELVTKKSKKNEMGIFAIDQPLLVEWVTFLNIRGRMGMGMGMGMGMNDVSREEHSTMVELINSYC